MPGRAPLPLDLTVLGQVRAASPDGAELLPVSGLGANLLVALALEPRGLSTARAIEETWPDAPPASGRAALQTLVSRLRGAHHAGLVASTAVGYALGVPPERVDLGRATAAAEEARTLLAAGDPDGAARTAGAALELWDGEPGTGAPAGAVVTALRTRADAARRQLLRVRTAALLDGPADRAAAEGAVRAAEDLVALAPLDDTAHLLLLRALHAAGRTSEAVAAFARYREQLRDTLGTDPSAEVAAYHLELLSAASPRAGAGPGSRPDPPPADRTGPRGPGVTRPAGSPPARPAVDPPPTRPGPPGLRVAPTALIGRDGDVRAVEELLRTAPVVTVLGTGGLGKTRLVQEVARRAAGRFPVVHVAELAGVRDDADVLPALAAALQLPDPTTRRGVADVRSRPLSERVLDRLGEQPTLLVLDNCEHVLDGAATWVAEVVAALPSLQVLTTSRSPLGVRGERVHPLAPLPAREPDGAPGPAVRLFTERATAVRPGVSLPTDVVERLCRRLDGLPLAIELAAARTRSLTVVEVERRLSDRFALLVTGAAGAPERHRTLRAVIAWSWDLLTERSARSRVGWRCCPTASGWTRRWCWRPGDRTRAGCSTTSTRWWRSRCCGSRRTPGPARCATACWRPSGSSAAARCSRSVRRPGCATSCSTGPRTWPPGSCGTRAARSGCCWTRWARPSTTTWSPCCAGSSRSAPSARTRCCRCTPWWPCGGWRRGRTRRSRTCPPGRSRRAPGGGPRPSPRRR
ncbi:hypothetical protein K5O09_01205 [Cellulomonas sp. C5510]|nr:hypothetical protein K5O09_01205 [Cellulomonas sp. C5510]